jgi:hypothetical protein
VAAGEEAVLEQVAVGRLEDGGFQDLLGHLGRRGRVDQAAGQGRAGGAQGVQLGRLGGPSALDGVGDERDLDLLAVGLDLHRLGDAVPADRGADVRLPLVLRGRGLAGPLAAGLDFAVDVGPDVRRGAGVVGRRDDRRRRPWPRRRTRP